MNEYADDLKNKLTKMIEKLTGNIGLYVKKPGKDFTRKRKLPFESVIHLLISMGGNSVYKELLETSGYDLNTATASAFIQQREKILACAFEHLLHDFTNSQPALKKHRGYRLFAADGSDLHFATNPDDTQTYTRNNEISKGVNLIHVNALYDLCNRLYIDTLIQPLRQLNEKKALVDMVDRSAVNDKAIIIADRNYENYNIFAHIERKGWNYLIRVKDIDSNGILSGLRLPDDDEFDVIVQRLLTRRQTKHIKSNPDIYKFLPSNVNFDFLPLKSKEFYPISLRSANKNI
jgi:hypothetical protein